jgi:hypothetical protein
MKNTESDFNTYLWLTTLPIICVSGIASREKNHAPATALICNTSCLATFHVRTAYFVRKFAKIKFHITKKRKRSERRHCSDDPC